MEASKPRSRQMMEMGLYLSFFLTFQVLLVPLQSQVPLLSLLSVLLFFLTPYVPIRMARRYRDRYLEGRITYWQAYSLLFGAVLFAFPPLFFGYYIGIRYIHSFPEVVANLDHTMLQTWSDLYASKEGGGGTPQLFSDWSARDLALYSAFTVTFIGLIFNYIAAFFVMKTTPRS